MATKKNSYHTYLKLITTEKDELKIEAYINDVTFDKTYKPSRYMIQRFLSMHHKTRQFIIIYQQILDKLDNENHLRFLMKVIPHVGFIKYIK